MSVRRSSVWLCVVGAAGFAAFPAAGQMTPVSVTGFNRDIVVENTAAIPYSDDAEAFDTFNAYAWYERGLPGSTKGLPQGGAFTSVSNPLIEGQLEPYNAPNALFLDVPSPTGMLSFAPIAQRPYDFLVVFACSSNQGGLGELVINFTDLSSSSPISFNAQDWFFVTTNNALNNLGRVSLNSGNFEDGSAGNPRIYQTVIDMGASGLNTRAVASITFTKPNVGGAAQNTVIMGVSGQPVPGVTGACTFPDGTCGLLPEATCTGAGGTYQGDGTSCPPTGACIAANGDCSVRTAANCAFVGGMYQGDGVACPGAGACCLAAGTCVQRNSFQCEFAGGTFQGVGTSCDLAYTSITPPPPGGGAFEDISGTGTQITIWIGSVDDGYASIPIGFTFPFYSNSYTDAFVGTNGFITFGAGSTTFTNVCLPATTAPNNGVYPLWDDYHLHASHTGRVFYETRMSPNRLIVQWDLVGHYNGGGVPIDQSTFEGVLFESGGIEYRYGTITPVPACGAGGAGASVGIENSTGTMGLSYDNTLLGTGGTSLEVQAVSPCPSCTADFNRDGTVNSQDYFDFLVAFFGGEPGADFNRDGTVNSQDYFDFLVAFFTGC